MVDPNIQREDLPPAVAALRDSLSGLIAESQALRADVHSAEVARKRANQINLGLLGLLSLFVALLVAIGWQGNETIKQSRETNKAIADCATPGGRCYEEGQARTGGAISAVVQISVFVSQCGRLWPGESGPDYDIKLQQCVLDRLTQARQQATPAPADPTPTPTMSSTRPVG